MTLDLTKISDWLIGGTISLFFGIVGGFFGAWINDYFDRKRERRRSQQDIREGLIRGVSEFMYEQSKRDITKRFSPVRPNYSPNSSETRRGISRSRAFVIGLIITTSISLLVLTLLGFWR